MLQGWHVMSACEKSTCAAERAEEVLARRRAADRRRRGDVLLPARGAAAPLQRQLPQGLLGARRGLLRAGLWCRWRRQHVCKAQVLQQLPANMYTLHQYRAGLDHAGLQGPQDLRQSHAGVQRS
jgi:hypothetical protein